MPHFRRWAADLILDTGAPWVLEPFQEWFVEDLFAGFAEAWLIVPEGNTKTTTLAGLGLYHAENREFAVVPVAAASREQAEIMYRQAEGFVLRSPALHEAVFSAIQQAKGKRKTEVPRFLCLEGYRRINHYAGGRIQVFAADDRTGDGVIPTLGIVDEPHRQRDLSLYRTWAGKLAKRNGQIAAISTRGEPGSDFEETLAKIKDAATSVQREGSFTRYMSGRIVLHEWALPEDQDPDDLEAVKATNPFSGITVPMLAEKRSSATMTDEHWLRFVCNRPQRGHKAAIADKEWAAAKAPDPTEIPAGEAIWLGLDVAWKWDTTAAVPLWWRSDTFRLLGDATILIPPRDGTSLDPDLVEEALLAIHRRNPVHTVVMDMTRAEQLARWIEQRLGATVLDRPQTNAWAAQDYEKWMEALREGWLKHTGDAGLASHVLNAVAKEVGPGLVRFDRPSTTRSTVGEQERRVIDALTAGSMVHAVAALQAENPPKPANRTLVTWGGRR